VSFIFNLVRFGSSALFLVLHLFAMIGIIVEVRRGNRARVSASRALAPKVSVVIPAHDEIARLGPLLESLRAQVYPSFDVVFVDDRSTDGTTELLEAFAASWPEGRVRLLRLTANPGPNFKQYGLARGIEASDGELVLLTDADCEMAGDWISAMAAQLADEKVGLAVGPVFKRIEGERFYDLYQAFDHAVRYTYLAGTTGLGAPCGAFGNNMIVRRTALDRIGGYEAVPYSVTEDAALVAVVRLKSGLSIRAATSKSSCVVTQGEKGWKELTTQCLRWNNGGLFAPDPVTRIGFRLLIGFISLGVVVLPLIPFFPSLWPISVSVYLAMTMNTIAALALAGKNLPPPGLRYVPQTLFTPAYNAFLTLLGILRIQVRWKGEKLG